MKPKIFYTIFSILFFLGLVIFYNYYFSKNFFHEPDVCLLIMITFYFTIVIVTSILYCNKLYFNLPFVTDLVEKPKNPVYRLENYYEDLYKIIKSEVGFCDAYEGFIILFPPLALFRYKTMVDNETEYTISKDLLNTGVSLEEYYEKEWFEANKDKIKKKEIERQKEELINGFNKEYKENFKK